MRSYEENKKRFDKNKNVSVFFNVGDYVFVENGNKLNRHKLDEIRIDAFPITRKLSNMVFKKYVDLISSNALRLYHVSKMIKANSNLSSSISS